MPAPLYYLSRKSPQEMLPKGKPSLTLLQALNLAGSWSGVDPGTIQTGQVTAGPDGQPGALFHLGAMPPQYKGLVTYVPGEQEWRQASDGVWLGWRHDAGPDEDGLARVGRYGGWRLTLAGGFAVTIPVLRREDGTTELPRDIKLDPYREEIKAAYRGLWERSAEVFDWIVEGQLKERKEAAVRFGVDVLGLNYRYGPIEQNALGLIDSDNYFDVACVAVDLASAEAIMAAKKKKEESQAESQSLPLGTAA